MGSRQEKRYAIVLTTAGSDEQAQVLARELVERRLAACVNIVAHVRSIYRWKGAISEDEERLLVIKTEARLFDEVRTTLRALHSYELPEVLMLPVADGDPDYLNWLSDSVK